jgi:hypothetical protein
MQVNLTYVVKCESSNKSSSWPTTTEGISPTGHRVRWQPRFVYSHQYGLAILTLTLR